MCHLCATCADVRSGLPPPSAAVPAITSQTRTFGTEPVRWEPIRPAPRQMHVRRAAFRSRALEEGESPMTKIKPLTASAALGCCAVIGTAVLAGCGPHGAARVAAPSATAGSRRTVTLDERADHTTVTVGLGTTVRVELHSTYWSAFGSSAPRLLTPTGRPSSSPSTGPSCHPGSGCGTDTADFVARAAGTADLTASRTTCGEAAPCAPDRRTFTVTIEISG